MGGTQEGTQAKLLLFQSFKELLSSHSLDLGELLTLDLPQYELTLGESAFYVFF